MTEPYVQRVEYSCPPCVVRPCNAGSTCYIGFLPGQKTVLKYAFNDDNRSYVEVEARIFDALGSHPHILKYHGKNEHGLILDYAANGSVKQYLEKSPFTPTKQRVTWCRELVEAMVHIHSKSVLHCNISASNLLLDVSLSSKLADFQGTLKDPVTDATIVTGGITEVSKWYLPRDFGADSVKSDIFALGSTIHEIVSGYEPFPELDSGMDGEVIQGRFVAAQYPDVRGMPGGEIIRKCWLQQYSGAHECLTDLKALEEQC